MHHLQPHFRILRRSMVMKVTQPSPKPESEKCMDINTTSIINAAVSHQAARAGAVSPRKVIARPDAIPLLEPAGAEVSTDTLEVSPPKLTARPVIEKSPVSFEEIPGPTVLKLWEKYWKYVPLLGTQGISSLLINRFTQGQLKWNRNVTPLKFLFNQYGCVVRINGPLVNDIVLIHRPEHIAEVFREEGKTPIRSSIDILQEYRLNHRKYKFGGPFSLQGAEWMELRKKMEKPFNEISSTFFSKIDVVCDELVNRIRKIRNRQDEVPANFHTELMRWGMECYFTLVFNKHVGFLDHTGLNPTSEATKMVEALSTAHKYMSRCETGFQVWRFFETPFAKRLFSACDVLDGVIGKYIRNTQSKLQSGPATNMDKMYLNSEFNSPMLEKLLLIERMNPDDLSTILLDMLLLGTQATVNCESFLLYFLAKNPRAQRRLYDEVQAVTYDTETLTEQSLKHMPYLKACLQESLRLRPAFPYLTRLLPNSITLHGYTIPKGTFMIMANQITSQREENFEDPDKFRPERWMQEEVDEDSYQKYSFLPFGHGVRSCLGKNMARMQMMLLTAKLLKQFKIEYDYADMKSRYWMVNVPSEPLRFRFVDRE